MIKGEYTDPLNETPQTQEHFFLLAKLAYNQALFVGVGFHLKSGRLHITDRRHIRTGRCQHTEQKAIAAYTSRPSCL